MNDIHCIHWLLEFQNDGKGTTGAAVAWSWSENGAHIYAAHVMATQGSEGKKKGEKSCESWHLTHVIWKKG